QPRELADQEAVELLLVDAVGQAALARVVQQPGRVVVGRFHRAEVRRQAVDPGVDKQEDGEAAGLELLRRARRGQEVEQRLLSDLERPGRGAVRAGRAANSACQ